MGRAIGLGIALAAVWLLLSGHYTPLILSFGAGSVVLVVYLAHRMDVVDHEGVPIPITARLFVYVPWLMKEIFVSNIAVAKVILSPDLPISPVMVKYKACQQTDVGKFFYANSITLTPGTITTGIEGDQFEIHALTRDDVEASGEEDRMDELCAWLEGSIK